MYPQFGASTRWIEESDSKAISRGLCKKEKKETVQQNQRKSQRSSKEDPFSIFMDQYSLPPDIENMFPTPHVTGISSKIPSDILNYCDISYNDLHVIRQLGSGSSGLVKEVLHIPSGKIMAVKIVSLYPSCGSLETVYRELNVLRCAHCPYITDYYGASICDGHQLWILMEYMALGSLESVRKRLGGTIPESVLGKTAYCALCGLQYMHTKLHMLHCDLKPENILVNTNGSVKITDFGMCRRLDDFGMEQSSQSGTTSYLSISYKLI